MAGEIRSDEPCELAKVPALSLRGINCGPEVGLSPSGHAVLASSQQPCDIGKIIVPILQVRSLPVLAPLAGGRGHTPNCRVPVLLNLSFLCKVGLHVPSSGD